MIEYNAGILNHTDLGNSFFCLSKTDPTVGFPFDATRVAGHTYPEVTLDTSGEHLTILVTPFATRWGCEMFRFRDRSATRLMLRRCE